MPVGEKYFFILSVALLKSAGNMEVRYNSKQ